MSLHELAGKQAPRSLLVNIPRLVAAYFTQRPDISDPAQRVSFGTSGHRGSSLKNTFNEDHILAISQAICEYRKSRGIRGPLFLGMDTHALSEPAKVSALEVFAANGVNVVIQQDHGYTPTPVISHAILTHNRAKGDQLSDGVVITPSHNPPQDGGFKYNPPEGGPADPETTRKIENRANELLASGLKGIKRIPYEKAIKAETTHAYDFVSSYIRDLKNVVDMERIAKAGLRIGTDPLGGSAIQFWDPISEVYGISIEVVNRWVEPTFSFVRVDKDGQIRMDCSSPYAMAGLIRMKDNYDVAFGNDPDADRHGIVTKSGGLMNPNHYLSVAIWYLFRNRPGWKETCSIGKTLVSSSMMDRIASHLGRNLVEVPVGFKWFVKGLLEGSLGFGGEESAGGAFLRKDGAVWVTDKDGIIMDLLAAEIMARTGKDPARIYTTLEERFGSPVYERIDLPATPEQKRALQMIRPGAVRKRELAGDPIIAKLTHAPANGAPIGGLKVITENGWFAARPSGTEEIYKIYAESFKGRDHLHRIQDEAQSLLCEVFASSDTAGRRHRFGQDEFSTSEAFRKDS